MEACDDGFWLKLQKNLIKSSEIFKGNIKNILSF